MKLAAAYAIAGAVSEEDIASGRVIPDVFNKEAFRAVAEAVARAARDTGAV
jgi:malate dehydrogenase (oxaloacetate-decarboxylating)